MYPPEDVPAGCPMPPSDAYKMAVEQIVETDDDLMNRYLEGEDAPVRRPPRGRRTARSPQGKLVPSSASRPGKTSA